MLNSRRTKRWLEEHQAVSSNTVMASGSSRVKENARKEGRRTGKLSTAVNILAREADCVVHAQVNCKDRRGLLSDIILALKSMPLEVRRQLSLRCTVPTQVSHCRSL